MAKSIAKRIAVDLNRTVTDKDEKQALLLVLELASNRISTEEFNERVRSIPPEILQRVPMIFNAATLRVLIDAVERIEKALNLSDSYASEPSKHSSKKRHRKIADIRLSNE